MTLQISFTVASLVLLLGLAPAEAATYTVTNTSDSGPGSLRQAIADANATPADDVIEFDPNVFVTPQTMKTISLTGGSLFVHAAGRLTIDGPGADLLTVSGMPQTPEALPRQVFMISAGANALIDGLKITGGIGVGFRRPDGTFHPGGGGGIFNQGTTTVQNSLITENRGFNDGGGIYNEGSLIVRGSTISRNFGEGGGLHNRGGVATIIDSTINDNRSAAWGGAILNWATLVVINSTISGNRSLSFGGGIYNFVGTSTLISSTSVGNFIEINPEFGGSNGITVDSGQAIARNSIIVDGVEGPFVSQGYNLLSEADAKLGPLAWNGGPTQTYALLPGSLALDAGDPAGAFDTSNNPLPFDQRGTGYPRISGGRLDIGAYELHDNDSDGLPDESDVDDDNDGLADVADNCPLGANADQLDYDHDGIGNACDTTPGSPVEIVFVSTRDSASPWQLNLEIYGMRADGSDVVRLTNHAAVDLWPALSPDKSRILFTSTRDNNRTEIFVMDVDGANVRRLTTNAAIEGAATWSPDGTRIVFTSVRSNNADIYVMNADGSQLTRLTTHAKADMNAAWGANGRIAFASNRTGNFDIYTMKADGTDVRRLTTHNDDDAFPTWSPDGSKIAFASTRDGNAELYVMSASGAAQTRLTNHRAIDAEPSWGLNNRILFTSTRGGNTKIYALNPATGAVTQLTNSPTGYDLSPHW
jgi:hypothetical protein